MQVRNTMFFETPPVTEIQPKQVQLAQIHKEIRKCDNEIEKWTSKKDKIKNKVRNWMSRIK